jgi:hypothetical protein
MYWDAAVESHYFQRIATPKPTLATTATPTRRGGSAGKSQEEEEEEEEVTWCWPLLPPPQPKSVSGSSATANTSSTVKADGTDGTRLGKNEGGGEEESAGESWDLCFFLMWSTEEEN